MLLPYTATKSQKLIRKDAIAIDFDGVICLPSNTNKMGVPNIGAQEAITQLAEQYRIIIFTLRAKNKNHVADWLDFYEIPYHEITDVKPDALAYIDDKAIRHISWPENLRQLERYGILSG